MKKKDWTFFLSFLVRNHKISFSTKICMTLILFSILVINIWGKLETSKLTDTNSKDLAA